MRMQFLSFARQAMVATPTRSHPLSPAFTNDSALREQVTMFAGQGNY